MNCQRCQEPATVHLTETVNGRRREVHLCSSCARESGVLPEGSETSVAAFPLDKVVQGLILTHVGELVGELAGLTCPDCGLRFMEYRAGGLLGCPNDYGAFARGLLPLLQRSHGATRHVGKVARPRPGASALLRTRALLRDAIAREDYEQAARLRDQIRLKDAEA